VTADLVAFLRARLDEDERIARACDGHTTFDGTGIVPGATARGPVMAVLPSHVATHIARHDPARVLAEVDAKRRIIDGLAEALDRHADYITGTFTVEDVLRLLALPYRDHPGYRPEWAPET